jgi:phage shock protein PspC (stress-responsive transcriptional regulator)
MARSTALGEAWAMSEHTAEPAAVKRLERSRDDRMLAGVCGGLARYFGIHPAFYRVGFVVLTLIGGAGILIYAAAALVIPDEGQEDSIASGVLRERRERPWPLIGLGLVAVAGAVLLSNVSIWPRGDAAWILLLLAGWTILMLTRKHPAKRQAEEAPEEGGEAPTAALAPKASGRVGRVAAAIGIAVGIFVTLVLIAAAIFAAVLPVHLGRGIGEENYRVVDIRDLRASYTHGIGDLRVDLGGVRLPVGETHLKARVDIGRVTVIVPRDAALQVRGEARFGEVELLGQSTEGSDADRTIRQQGKRVLVLDGRVGAGKLVVERAVR